MRAVAIMGMTALAAVALACDYGTNPRGQDVAAQGDRMERRADASSQMDEEAAGQTEQQAREARQLVQDATKVVERMSSDPEVADLLDQAEGVFIVPRYGKAAVGVGARGGEGLLLVSDDGTWSAPLFYDVGGISVGPQFGATGGDVAMLLMSQEALQSFREEQNFSFNANAGFTLVDYSARGQASAGKGDVILWSDTKGAFAGISLGVSDIVWDDEANRAFYDQTASREDILSGRVEEDQYAKALQRKLGS